MTPVTEAMRSALEAALRRDVEGAMFPLGNLARHGIGATGAPHATRYWIGEAPAAPVLAVSEWGMAMVHAPAGLDAARVADALRGRALRGICGPAETIRAVMAEAGLAGAPTVLDGDEPQFSLDLDALDAPMRRARPLERETALEWRAAYEAELHLGRSDAAAVAASVDGWIAAGSHRMLFEDGMPVALTGFNAALADIVQVGGVYVPPPLRGRGLAGRAVALHLAEARARGVRRATLFAASEAAARAYRRIGFARVGTFALVLFDGTVAA